MSKYVFWRGRRYLLKALRISARFVPNRWAWQLQADYPYCQCKDPILGFPLFKRAEVVAAGGFYLEEDGIAEAGYAPPTVVRFREHGYCRACLPRAVSDGC